MLGVLDELPVPLDVGEGLEEPVIELDGEDDTLGVFV